MKGSDRTFGKWLGGNWIWLAVVGAMLSCVTVLGYKIFSTYAATFPHISNDHTAWASFGSLLAGFFTLTGTVATVATLLFLAHQNKAMQKVNQAQLDTLTFERYINHRKLFFERLTELQTTFDDKFIFVNVDSLYTKVFPKNGPTHLEFNVVPKSNLDEENLIGRITVLLNELEVMLNESSFKKINDLEFINKISMINDGLNIRWLSSVCDGDVIFKEENTGFNIYSLEEFVYRVKLILNSLLFYTCNSNYEGLMKGSFGYGRESLIELFFYDRRFKSLLRAHKGFGNLFKMEDLYFELKKFKGNKRGILFGRTLGDLELIFQSHESVFMMRDTARFRSFVDGAIRECNEAMIDDDSLLDNPAFRSVKSIIDTMSSNCRKADYEEKNRPNRGG